MENKCQVQWPGTHAWCGDINKGGPEASGRSPGTFRDPEDISTVPDSL